MTHLRRLLMLIGVSVLLTLVACAGNEGSGPAGTSQNASEETTREPIPLKESKLIIEHNATDKDTGFQAFLDSEGWQRMEVSGPQGRVLRFEADGSLSDFGLTELFFETVEPPNADVPLDELLAKLPAGKYLFEGVTPTGTPTSGTVTLTHDIPAGPVLVAPKEDATVPTKGLVVRWEPVTQTIQGEPIEIVAYQVIVERDEDPPPNRIGKGLSVYMPASATMMTVPEEFLEPGTDYDWEVLAIERSGNQTLSSATFSTE